MASIFCDVTHAFNGPHSFCAHSMISETRTVPTIHAQVNQSQLQTDNHVLAIFSLKCYHAIPLDTDVTT